MTPLALTVGIAGMTVFQQATLDHEARLQSGQRLVAEHVVDAGPAGLRLDAIDELAERGPGTVIGLAPTTVFANYELDPYVATAVTPGRLGDVLDLGIVEGSVTGPNAGEVMLSEDAASSMGAGVGDRVDIRLGDGMAAAPMVVAVYERSLGFGDVVLPWQLVEGHLTDAVVSVVLVDDGGDASATRSSLARFEVDHPGTHVGGREIVQASEDANAETQAWVGYVLLGLVIVFCTFAVFNTLMLAISERGREFGLLQLVGGTRRQVVTMMGLEAVMVVITGLWLGAAIAATTVMPVAKAVTGSYQPHTPPTYGGRARCHDRRDRTRRHDAPHDRPSPAPPSGGDRRARVAHEPATDGPRCQSGFGDGGVEGGDRGAVDGPLLAVMGVQHLRRCRPAERHQSGEVRVGKARRCGGPQGWRETADGDDVRVEGIHESGDAAGEIPGDRGDRAPGVRVGGRQLEGSRCVVAGVVGRRVASVSGEGAAVDLEIPATACPARASEAMVAERQVTELAASSAPADCGSAVDDQGATDTNLDGEVQRRRRAASGTGAGFGEAGQRGVVADQERCPRWSSE